MDRKATRWQSNSIVKQLDCKATDGERRFPWQIMRKAAVLLLGGTVVVGLFSDPMVDAVRPDPNMIACQKSNKIDSFMPKIATKLFLFLETATKI